MAVYKPIWPLRLFGRARWSLELNEHGLRLDDEIWTWEELQSCQLVAGWFSSTIEFEGRRLLQLKGVSRAVARSLLELSRVAKHIRGCRDEDRPMLFECLFHI